MTTKVNTIYTTCADVRQNGCSEQCQTLVNELNAITNVNECINTPGMKRSVGRVLSDAQIMCANDFVAINTFDARLVEDVVVQISLSTSERYEYVCTNELSHSIVAQNVCKQL